MTRSGARVHPTRSGARPSEQKYTRPTFGFSVVFSDCKIDCKLQVSFRSNNFPKVTILLSMWQSIQSAEAVKLPWECGASSGDTWPQANALCSHCSKLLTWSEDSSARPCRARGAVRRHFLTGPVSSSDAIEALRPKSLERSVAAKAVIEDMVLEFYIWPWKLVMGKVSH